MDGCNDLLVFHKREGDEVFKKSGGDESSPEQRVSYNHIGFIKGE